jgi:hypothetical protein
MEVVPQLLDSLALQRIQEQFTADIRDWQKLNPVTVAVLIDVRKTLGHIVALQSKLDSAVEALTRYGRHDFLKCDSTKILEDDYGNALPNRLPCTCGLDATLARLGIDTGGKTA